MEKAFTKKLDDILLASLDEISSELCVGYFFSAMPRASDKGFNKTVSYCKRWSEDYNSWDKTNKVCVTQATIPH